MIYCYFGSEHWAKMCAGFFSFAKAEDAALPAQGKEDNAGEQKKDKCKLSDACFRSNTLN